VEKTPQIKQLEMTISQLEKGGYPHFMLKEIFEQPRRSRLYARPCQRRGEQISIAGIIDHKDKFLNAKRIIIWLAARRGMRIDRQIRHRRICTYSVEVEYSSEFRYRNPVIDRTMW
jgi:glucosamine--fructose-6-phosphate aminotransferase (isomerizing)